MAEATVARVGWGGGENEGVNVQVLLRCRPMSDKELAERTPQVISCNEALREVTLYQNAGGKQLSRTFRFDKVFSSESGQEKLYKQAITPIVQEVMDGFNCTIFAYGQTGTGKTYTMEGGPRRSDDGKSLSAEAGVIPRSIKQIFDTIDASDIDSTVKVQFLEIYNEELTDLLFLGDVKDDSKRLRLLEDRNGVVVQGLEEVTVKSATEIYQVLDRGTARRRTAETQLNKVSSRSHSVFIITILMREVTPEGEVLKVGKLNLVDLAGSENISRSGAKEGRAREAGSINQSLLTLGRVITALVEHSGHVPYRDSKLTRLLRDSLGGKTKTCIIATIAPTVQCQEETINTLDYAHRAKNIRNRPEVNQKISATAKMREMSVEVEKLRMELVAQREKNGVYISKEKYDQDELERIQLRDTVKALRDQLKLQEDQSAEALEKLKTESENTISSLESEKAALQRDNEIMDARLQEHYRTIHERQYVIGAYRRAEEDIVKHADTVRSELSAAVRDIGTLFSSFDELSGLHSGDRDAFKSVRNMLKARFEGIGKSFSAAAESQRRQLQAMSSSLAAFKEQKQSDLEQLGTRIASIQSMIASMKETAEGRVRVADEAAATALDQAYEAGAAHAASSIATSQALEDACREAVDALAAAIEQQACELASFTQQQSSMAGATCEALRSAMQRFSGNFESLQATALQTQDLVARQTSELSAGLGGFVTRYKDTSSKQQVELLAQITALVHAFAEERASDVAREVQSLQQQAVEGSSAVKDHLGSISQASISAVKTVQEAEASVSTSVLEQQQQVDKYSGGLVSTLHSFREKAQSIKQGVSSQVASSHSATEAFRQGLQQACSQGAAAVQREVRACVECSTTEASSTGIAVADLRQALEAGVENDCKSAQDWASTSTALAANIEATQREQGESLVSLDADAGSAIEGRLEMQQLTSPPAQREYKVPSASEIRELRCPPEDKLVERCHAESPHVFAVPVAQVVATSPRAKLIRSASEPATNGENATPMPPVECAGAVQPVSMQVANGSMSMQSPRSSTAGLRSRIPSRIPVSGSPASVKDLAMNGNSRPLLADKTNSKQSILSEWSV